MIHMHIGGGKSTCSNGPAMTDNIDAVTCEDCLQAIGYEGWLATRPECVQKLAAEFPPNTVFHIGCRSLCVIGWTEDDSLIVTPVDPCKDYAKALAAKEYLHASCVRNALK